MAESMKKENLKYVCWSCGKSLKSEFDKCSDCSVGAILKNPKPKIVMPVCGGREMEEGLREVLKEAFISECCSCHRDVLWANYDQWWNGPCPSCGAMGNSGRKQ